MESSKSPLLELPPEIRNAIYQLVFTVDAKHSGSSDIHRRPKTGNNRKTHSVQSLLLTCYQVYDEACGVFYDSNKTSLNIHQIKPFVDAMSPKRISSITHISIYEPNNRYGNLKFLTYLACLPKLESFTLMVSLDRLPDGRIFFLDQSNIFSRDQSNILPKRAANLRHTRQVLVELTGSEDNLNQARLQIFQSEIQNIQVAFDKAIARSMEVVAKSRKLSRAQKAMAKKGRFWAED